MRRSSFILMVALLSLAGCAASPTTGAPPQAETSGRQLAANEADVYIEGMACPFCTYNVEKKIRELSTVESVTTDLNTGVAHVVLRHGASPDVNALWEKVKKSGFTPKKIVTHTGTHRGK